MYRAIKNIILVVFLGFNVFFISGCQNAGLQKYSQERMVIGTYVRVDVCREGRNKDQLASILSKVWDRFAYFEKHLNAYDSASDIGRINQASGAFQYIPEEVYRLIEKSIDYSNKTQGAFDITVKPLINLWIDAEINKRIPTDAEVDTARNNIGVDRIKMRKGEEGFLIACDTCQLDLGGIAKGYAVDQVAKMLRADGIIDFLIDAGGDMYASGKNCSGNFWRIGVRHPRQMGQLIGIIDISDQAVTTSGDYQQFFEIDGKSFSHIINPLTGYPQKNIISATVIAPTAMEADVFSTALMVWDAKKGINFIDSLGAGYEAMVVTENAEDGLKQHQSSEYAKREGIKAMASGYYTK